VSHCIVFPRATLKSFNKLRGTVGPNIVVRLLAKSPHCSNARAKSGPIGNVPKPTLTGITQQRYRTGALGLDAIETNQAIAIGAS